MCAGDREYDVLSEVSDNCQAPWLSLRPAGIPVRLSGKMTSELLVTKEQV